MMGIARAAGPPLPPDQEQRGLIVSELERNIIVEAAAGTGKTTSMMERMLALLRTGRCESVRTMAAVTFTRKAAAELRSRFQVALERAVREAADEEKERLEAALTHIEQCFIGTIHSFCARLLRERPVEAGVDLAFEEIDEDEDKRLRAEAWDAFLAELIAGDPRGLLDALGGLGLGVSELRPAFESFADFPDVEDWPVPEDKVEPEFARVRDELRIYTAHMSELAPRLSFECGTDTLVPTLLRMPRIISHFEDLDRPDQLMEALEFFDSKPQIRYTLWVKNGGFSKEEALGEMERWDRFRDDVAMPALRAWRELRYGAVMPVLHAARAVYVELRGERGQLNFQDLLMKAAALLRENPAVRRYFQSRFTHLLVDEFQDTDPIQAEVIMLLCSSDPDETDWRACVPRPGSLFLVGDPKQSIYRFRRADIATYNDAKRIILAGGGLEARLSANFRAAPDLIAWVNGVFEPGERTCDAPGGAMLRFPASDSEESPRYERLSPGREEGATGMLSGLYRLQVPEEFTNKETAAAFEADLIARFIRHALDSAMTVPRARRQLEDGQRMEVGPGDFMVVTRNTGFLGTYARALQLYGIPHQVTGGTALNELDELRLFKACLQAVVHPDDPVALVAALRSELFGLSDSDLYAFKKSGGVFSYRSPLPADLAPRNVEAFVDAFKRLTRYSLWLSRLPYASACERIASDLGLPALAAARPGGDMQAGSLGKALELLRGMRTEQWSAAQLVEYLDTLVESTEKHDGISALSGVLPAVRVMNLHKVKGLEAPVVFLADTSGENEFPVDRHIDRSGDTITGYLSISGEARGRRGGKLLAHPVDWERLAEREAAFERAEALRLRYVAATRAASAMIVSQRVKGNERNPWCHFGPFLDECRDLPDPGPQAAPVRKTVPLAPQEIAEAGAAITSRLRAVCAPTYNALPLKEHSLSLPVDAVPVESAVDGETPRPIPGGEHGVEWGGVIHLLLQTAMSEPGADLVRLAEAALAEGGLGISLAPQAAALARSVTDSEIWRRALRSETRFVEVPLQAQWVEGMAVPTILRGAIDLVFREDGGWVLVDYKTDLPGSGGLEAVARRYAAQVRLYSEAWEKCTGEPVREAFLYFTAAAALVKIDL
ncbi:MAG: UvrD-helicase domain-containing protein [Actinomycetota bacterium]